MFENRKGHMMVLKRKLGNGEYVIQTVSKASLRALRRHIDRLRMEQKTNNSKASHELEHSDKFYEDWKADNENNLIDLER